MVEWRLFRLDFDVLLHLEALLVLFCQKVILFIFLDLVIYLGSELLQDLKIFT